MTDEILAHISAPTSRKTDNLYQSLADVYHDFEPHQAPHDLHRPPRVPSRSSRASPKANAPSRDDSSDIFSTSPIIAPSKNSFGSFPSHISLDDHAGSSFVQGASQAEGDSTEYGSIPTSSRLERLEQLYQDWKQKDASKTSFSTSFRSSRQGHQVANDNDADTAFIEDTQLGLEALQSQLDAGEYSASQESTQSHAESEDYTGVFQISDVNEAELSAAAAAHVEAPSATPTRQNAITHDQALARQSATGAADPSTSSPQNVPRDTGTGIQRHSSAKKSRAPEVHDFGHLEIDVFPAFTEVSVSRPRKLPSQCTPHLAALKTQYPQVFKLSKKKHNPLADDRGYWVVDCGEWSVKSQLKFWSEMEDLVLAGKLSWGTTLHRISDSPNLLGQVRLYCWGELIEHIWLQMWETSEGRIAGTPTRWYDSGGAATLETVYGKE